jgi:hypothetical protein
MASSDATTVLRAQERTAIIQIASMIMNSAKSLSSWSRKISSSFHLSEVTELSDGMMVTIGNNAPEAHAFEHGSGIHGPGGSKYPIVAKNAPMLAFMGTNEFAGHLITVPSVQHPGVGARPFMAPAVEANRAAALELLKQAVGSSIKLTIKEAWKSK